MKRYKERMHNNSTLFAAYKDRSDYYCNISHYENRFPGSIGFIDANTEVFVVREKLMHRLFRPHFFLYNHKTSSIQSLLFAEIDKCDQSLLNFLNTVRYYSLDNNCWPLIRTYYDDLISEWEVCNKRFFPRKYMRK